MRAHDPHAAREGLFLASAPVLFVVLWSTGFIVARLVAPHSDPLTFLCARYACVIALLAGLAFVQGAPWPRSGREIAALAVAGVLLHGIYLGGVFWAVKHGLPAGIAGLLAGLQPLLTAAVAGPLLGETVGLRRWTGVVLGFFGAALVLGPKMGGAVGDIPPLAIIVGGCAVLAFTAGTIWQKRTGLKMDLRTGNVVQFTAALIPTAVVAAVLEDRRFDFAPELLLGLFWSVVVGSIGSVMLLLVLIRRGAVVKTAALLYLVPPVTAVMAWLLFGETFNPVQMGGMVLAAAGVALATRQPKAG
jgi:drug/metabolite transporter (DMT)-like permease